MKPLGVQDKLRLTFLGCSAMMDDDLGSLKTEKPLHCIWKFGPSLEKSSPRLFWLGISVDDFGYHHQQFSPFFSVQTTLRCRWGSGASCLAERSQGLWKSQPWFYPILCQAGWCLFGRARRMCHSTRPVNEEPWGLFKNSSLCHSPSYVFSVLEADKSCPVILRAAILWGIHSWEAFNQCCRNLFAVLIHFNYWGWHLFFFLFEAHTVFLHFFS